MGLFGTLHLQAKPREAGVIALTEDEWLKLVGRA
jgi:hypothetical protein